jgi:hypothetical protein
LEKWTQGNPMQRWHNLKGRKPEAKVHIHTGEAEALLGEDQQGYGPQTQGSVHGTEGQEDDCSSTALSPSSLISHLSGCPHQDGNMHVGEGLSATHLTNLLGVG